MDEPTEYRASVGHFRITSASQPGKVYIGILEHRRRENVLMQATLHPREVLDFVSCVLKASGIVMHVESVRYEDGTRIRSNDTLEDSLVFKRTAMVDGVVDPEAA